MGRHGTWPDRSCAVRGCGAGSMLSRLWGNTSTIHVRQGVPVPLGGERRRAYPRTMSSSPSVTIYHNPNCGSSKKALAAAAELGVEVKVVQYLKVPPDRATL